MATFDSKSRYVRNAATYEVVDRRSRRVVALSIAEEPVQAALGTHQRKAGQRLDHLANSYLSDPDGYWRIAELNDVVLPEALSEADEVEIPTEG